MIELKSVSGTLGAGSVRDVSFRLPNGKTYGVFSPSYADSVALLALMGGARTPVSGTILAGGFDLHREAKQARRGIAYLGADLLPDDAMTPIEYLMSVADLRDLPYDKTLRRVHELLELAELAEKKEGLIANLSHGEKRILCLLQTLLGNPEILILTSPLLGVTPKYAQKICDFIRYLGDTYTIFLCTPSANDLREMCDEIIVLQGGRFKTVLAANDENLEAETLTPHCEDAPAEEVASKKRASSRLKMLMQSSSEYEVLDGDEKEGKN